MCKHPYPISSKLPSKEVGYTVSHLLRSRPNFDTFCLHDFAGDGTASQEALGVRTGVSVALLMAVAVVLELALKFSKCLMGSEPGYDTGRSYSVLSFSYVWGWLDFA